MKDELVLTFKSNLLDALGRFQGINRDFNHYINAILTPENCRFLPRKQVEEDPGYKQIIPYVLIRCNDKFLYYIRGKRSGEQRLALNGSVGIGGHVSLCDDDLLTNYNLNVRNIYNNAVEREVSEEIDISTNHTDKIVAVLNDDSNDVGKVHFGIVHIWELKSQNVKKKEAKITKISFMTSEDLRRQTESLETWSQICLKYIIMEDVK
jgi:predicted NUDIX family phosphoesterase